LKEKPMIDTHGRKYLDPLIRGSARMLSSMGIKPDHVTLLAFIVGMTSAIIILFGWEILSVLLLWISGFLDALDGALARETGSSSSWGTVMDITFDRLVELALIICLALTDHSIWPALIILLSGIVFSMTIFLTVGALSERTSSKAFYYQAGLMERTEGFIFFSIMILFRNIRIPVTFLFSALIIITGLQRLSEAERLFRN